MTTSNAFMQLFSSSGFAGSPMGEGFSWLTGIGGLPGHASGTANTGGSRGEPRGIVHGQEAVIPLPSGGKVPVQLAAPPAASAGVTVNQNYSPNIDMRGADPEAVTRLERNQQKMAAEFEARTIEAVRKAQMGRRL